MGMASVRLCLQSLVPRLCLRLVLGGLEGEETLLGSVERLGGVRVVGGG